MSTDMTIHATQPRPTDRAISRRQMQRLAVAAGVTLKDGSPVVVGGDKCPPAEKIKKAIGFDARRMSRDKFSDAQDDYGAVRPYYAASHEGGDAVRAILEEWSGISDCDGEMDMGTLLQMSS